MHPRLVPLLASFVLMGTAYGQYTLDWGAGSWSDGTAAGTYNALAGANGPQATINSLRYDLGAGVTATVTLDRLADYAAWQAASGVYSDPLTATQYAPRYFAGGDVFGLGIGGRSGDAKTPAGATLTITFSQAVQGLSFRIGDIDAGGQRDVVTLTSDAPAWYFATSAAGAPVATGTTTLRLTATADEENLFGATAPSAWAAVNTGDAFVNTLSINLSGLVSGGKANSAAHGIWLSDISIAAIPEPSTYALLLGVGTLGVAIWRSRRR